MPFVKILMTISAFNCFKKAAAKDSMAAAAITRAESSYGDSFPTSGQIVIVCDEPEAMDLLACASTHCRDSFDLIRDAIRKANFRL
jgi:hypothetical protein